MEMVRKEKAERKSSYALFIYAIRKVVKGDTSEYVKEGQGFLFLLFFMIMVSIIIPIN